LIHFYKRLEMASSLLKVLGSGRRATTLLLEQAQKTSTALQQNDLHTSAPVAGTLEIPERLRGIPDADDPGFFEMVEYFFHKSCVPLRTDSSMLT